MLKVETKKLSAALAIATRCCGNAGALPILATVLIEAKGDGKIHLTSSNLDMGIATTVDAEIESAFAICIDGKGLSRIVSSLDPVASHTTMLMKGTALHVNSGPSKFRLMGIAAEEFPRSQELSGATTKLKQADLRALLVGVEEAQSDDEARYVLNGCYVSESGGKLHVVATDGRRLHDATGTAAGFKCGVILPAKTVSVLTALLADDGDVEVLMGEDSRRLSFTITRSEGDVVLVSKVVDGNYPNWKQVIPAGNTAEVEISRGLLREAIHRVSLACDEKSNAVRVKIDGKTIRLRASSPSGGEADETLECDAKDLKTEFAMNPQFILKALAAADCDKVTLCLNPTQSEVSPLLVRNGCVRAVIMPVRLT